MANVYELPNLRFPEALEIEEYYPHLPKKKEDSKQKSDIYNTFPTVPQVLRELREDRKQAIKDVFEVVKLMESYGIIQIKKEEPVVVVEDKSSAGKGFFIGVLVILALGAALL